MVYFNKRYFKNSVHLLLYFFFARTNDYSFAEEIEQEEE